MRNDLHANLTVRIFTDRKCFGPGVAELLRRVRELHSLRAAAMSMNMAYSKAWTVLRTAQEGLGVKLLRSSTAALDGVEAARYFAGLQADELIDILCEG